MKEDKEKRHAFILNEIRKKAKEVLPEGSVVRIFGSRARGDFREDSDWDLHILIPGPERLSLATIREFAEPFEDIGFELDEEINPIIHSFSGWKKRWFLPLRKNIEQDGIIL